MLNSSHKIKLVCLKCVTGHYGMALSSSMADPGANPAMAPIQFGYGLWPTLQRRNKYDILETLNCPSQPNLWICHMMLPLAECLDPPLLLLIGLTLSLLTFINFVCCYLVLLFPPRMHNILQHYYHYCVRPFCDMNY